MRFSALAVVVSCVLVSIIAVGTPAGAQRAGMFQGSADDPNIRYSAGPLDNPIDQLNAELEAGTVQLTFDGRAGYLQSAMAAIGLPVDSQMLVFSKGSLQGRKINQGNPRAVYFNDVTALGFVRDGDALEIATQDARQGVVFYTLAQTPVQVPRFKREMICLGCHMTGDTSGVPGLLLFSATPETDSSFGSTAFQRHTMPLTKRFGGWLVTGASMPSGHLGNRLDALRERPTSTLTTTEGLYDPTGYLSDQSDVAALMVFTHQVGTVNLMIRAGWEARMAGLSMREVEASNNPSPSLPVLKAVADDVVDSLLFIDEARFDGRVQGGSGFAEQFQVQGPNDQKGRSLRTLDLTTRLLRYPCSYLIYSPVFDGLPEVMRVLIYQRMWDVLSGAEQDVRYQAALSLADRQAIVEILRDTKPGLPVYFTSVLQ
jgi:hypothetical protein